MEENRKSRLAYWSILINPVFIVLYVIGLRNFSLLCQFGAVGRRLPVMLVCGGVGAIWIVMWTAKYFAGKRQSEVKPLFAKGVCIAALCIELLLILGATGYYGSKIAYSAKPYNGKLSWKLHEIKNSREIALKHDNLYEDGVKGVFTDLHKRVNLPSDLYLVNTFSLEFDEDGTITKIYGFFYGKDENGKDRSYLLDYDRSKSAKMIVWLDGYHEPDYSQQKRMSPMFELLEMADIQGAVKRQQQEGLIGPYSISYKGYSIFNNDSELICIDKNKPGFSHTIIGEPRDVSGYGVSLNDPGNDNMVLAQFVNMWDTIDAQELQEEERKEAKEKVEGYERGTCITDPDDGSLYYFLNETQGWRLVVVNAALGTRYYAMEYTEDAGNSWKQITDDPFAGAGGGANGIVFFDDQSGFIGLSNGSDDHAEIYQTTDGGNTFTQVALPMEGIAEVPNIEEYDYTFMPYNKDSVIQVEVGRERGEQEKLLFSLADKGVGWKYDGLVKAP